MVTPAQQQKRLVKRIKSLLADKPPEVQGAALAELLAIYLAGHAPKFRDMVLVLHVDVARGLVPACEAEIFPNGLPEEWT